MKRFLQIAGALYCVFAIIAAHTSLAPTEKAFADGARQRSEVVASPRTLLDHQRVYLVDSRATERDHYTVEVWTASWCQPCKVWKLRELPALLALGYDVVVKDIDIDEPPDSVEVVPTVRLYYKGDFVTQRTNWRAYEIEKFVLGRMSLKK